MADVISDDREGGGVAVALEALPPLETPDGRFGVDEVVGYTRSPSDVLRLLLYGVLSLLFLGLTMWAADGMVGLEQDVVAFLDFLNATAERIIVGVAALIVAMVAIAVFVRPSC